MFKFNTLKSYFPNISSTWQFITNAEYLGSVKIDVKSRDEEPTLITLYKAVFDVLGKIALSVSGIEETYSGTKEFKSHRINEVFRNKTINVTNPKDESTGISRGIQVLERTGKSTYPRKTGLLTLTISEPPKKKLLCHTLIAMCRNYSRFIPRYIL